MINIDSFFIQMTVTQTILFGVLCCGGPLLYTGYQFAMQNPERRRQVLYLKLAWTGIKALVLQKWDAFRERIFGSSSSNMADDQIDLYGSLSDKPKTNVTTISENTMINGEARYAIMKPANLEDLMD
jgi:hypothetical protein